MEKNYSPRDTARPPGDPPGMPYELWVNHDRSRPSRHDVGSVLCLGLLERCSRLQVEVRTVGHAPRPAWLTGTPTLWCQETDRIWTGHATYEVLLDRALEEAELRGREAAAKPAAAARPSQRPSNPMPPPPFRAQLPLMAGATAADDEPPSDGPEGDGAEGDALGDPTLWESSHPEAGDDGTDPPKLSSDDLNRFMRQRADEASAPPPTGPSPKALPPEKD